MDSMTESGEVVLALSVLAAALVAWLCLTRRGGRAGGGDAKADQQERRRQLLSARSAVAESIRSHSSAPLMLRLAWSEAASFDPQDPDWPRCGGANGSIRLDTELAHPSNAGLSKAVAALATLKDALPLVSWADLVQMAGALAVETSGGPKIHIKFGRVDADPAAVRECKSARLPCASAPFPDCALSPGLHVRNVFFRLGLNNAETVALMGGHTLGRAFKDRSGACECASGDAGATRHTRQSSEAAADGGAAGVGMAGGKSWTRLWLRFDNSYFSERADAERDPELLWLPTDDALLQCPEYRPHFKRFGTNKDAFFRTYASAHKKMSELGARFDPPEGLYLD